MRPRAPAMPEPTRKPIASRTSGLWTTRHVNHGAPPPTPPSQVRRADGRAQPARRLYVCGRPLPAGTGEVLVFRPRDPGLLRGQFSLWDRGHEWLASSLRWSILRPRHRRFHTGNKPLRSGSHSRGVRLRLRRLQAAQDRRRWRASAANPLTSLARAWRSFRKLDFELLTMRVRLLPRLPDLGSESMWPGHRSLSSRGRRSGTSGRVQGVGLVGSRSAGRGVRGTRKVGPRNGNTAGLAIVHSRLAPNR
jgi:hypothetical protein